LINSGLIGSGLIGSGLRGSGGLTSYVTDRTGRRFPVSGEEILNSVRLSLSDKEVNADRLLLDFFDETPAQMEEIFKAFKRKVNIPTANRENITRGLYGY
jgi:hypothetical protein